MASDALEYEPIGAQPKRSWRRALLLLLIAFAGGAAVMGYALTHWSLATRYFAPAAAPATTPQPLVSGGAPATPALPADPVTAAAIDRRVAELEGRLARIDARATAASGDADRAEGLLVAFAARRAIDRGVPLGYMEALLRERFGVTQPGAVAAVIGAARQPVTLDELQADLEELAPALASGDPAEGWWQSVRRELGGLIVLRQADTPSPAPADRLARAKFQLQAGHVGAALAEVARLPGRARATAWIAAARRYAAAHDALDVIETAALIDPRPAPAPPQPSAAPPAEDPPPAPVPAGTGA